MADGKVPGEADESVFSEDVSNQAHRFVEVKASTIRRDNAGGLLAAMLELMQPEVGELGSFRVGVDCDYPTIFLQFVECHARLGTWYLVLGIWFGYGSAKYPIPITNYRG
jgi:hypothetical protein